jgi:short-subunit dehydrogenase
VEAKDGDHEKEANFDYGSGFGLWRVSRDRVGTAGSRSDRGSADLAPSDGTPPESRDAGSKNLRVEKLDLLHPYDVQNALNWDIDTLVNNAAIAESGPITEIPMDLLRRMFEGNFFAPLELTQRFVRKFIDEGRPGKIVFTSSIGGLISILFGGPYAATKHALEAIAGSMQAELAPFGIQVQVINPGGYLTGFNETEAESSSHWMDDRKNYVKRADVQGFFDRILGDEQNRLDPQLMADAMIQIIPKDTGFFRNVVPQPAEEMVKTVQRDAWTNKIDLPAFEVKKTM